MLTVLISAVVISITPLLALLKSEPIHVAQIVVTMTLVAMVAGFGSQLRDDFREMGRFKKIVYEPPTQVE